MHGITLPLLFTAVLLLLSLLLSRVGGRLGIPGLVLFVVLGMLAGSEGPGGIPFDDYALEQAFGTVALAFILFLGGLETRWKVVRPAFPAALSLATLGVLLTSALVGVGAHLLLQLGALESLLMGAIVASTDASAVFSVLKARKLGLEGKIRPLLELESGINDPMAVFLTVGLTGLIVHPEQPWWSVLPLFFREMLIGALAGVALGRGAAWLFNHIRLSSEGLYPVLGITLVLLGFGLTATLGGSGFLAVYLMGLTMAQAGFLHQKSILRFFEGLGYLVEIGLFLTLGLLVFPSQLVPIALPALLLSLILMFVARPVAVFLSLTPFRMPARAQGMVAWVGLRGAVPVVLATIPLLEGVPGANVLFNVAFFIVLTSLLVQGTTLPLAARLLGVEEPLAAEKPMPLEYTPTGAGRNDLSRVKLYKDSGVVGRSILECAFPDEALIVLIERGGEYLIPRGSTVLEAGDELQILARKDVLGEVMGKIEGSRIG